jgi:hypothetical protein
MSEEEYKFSLGDHVKLVEALNRPGVFTVTSRSSVLLPWGLPDGDRRIYGLEGLDTVVREKFMEKV